MHGPGDDTHPDACCDAGETVPDGSQADDAAGFPVELDTFPARPFTAARGGVHLRDAARHPQQQGQRMFGDEAVLRAGKGIMVVELGACRQIGPYGAGAQDGRGIVGDGNSRHLHPIVANHHPPVAHPPLFQL